MSLLNSPFMSTSMSEQFIAPSKALTTLPWASGERTIELRGIGVMDLCVTKHIRIASKFPRTAWMCASKGGY